MIGQVPLVIGARPDMPAESPQEFFDYLKANPGTLNYGATGVGSIQHFAGELLNQALGTDVQVVQYPGERKSVVVGKSVSVRVDPGGGRIIQKTITQNLCMPHTNYI